MRPPSPDPLKRCACLMPSTRFAPPTEAPGLAARRIAADILDGVLHKRRTLDEQLEGPTAHPALKSLADRDRALMRRLVATILRRLEPSAICCRGCSIAAFRPMRRARKARF